MKINCGYCGELISTDYEGISCQDCGKELCMKCQGECENGECPICGQDNPSGGKAGE